MIEEAIQDYPSKILHDEAFRTNCLQGLVVFQDFVTQKVKGYRLYFSTFAEDRGAGLDDPQRDGAHIECVDGWSKGDESRRSLAGHGLGYQAFCLQVRGDLAEYCHGLGFTSWSSLVLDCVAPVPPKPQND
eukprot:3141879-Amphidinium_carterae.1